MEYLLIIAGALLVAAVVTFLLLSSSTPTKDKITNTTNKLFDVLNV
ncbi:MAG: hypothetical protein Q7K42_00835 [Candidatus Diapherotrites archaeon]|nr:hypothetical protein [Candidatus Diapherotrites archaeon]